MTLNAALNNALTGLSANTRMSEIVARNVANASTEGYAARRLDAVNRVTDEAGAGVLTAGPRRAGDAFVTADRRAADAQAARDRTEADATDRIAKMLAPGEGQTALSTQVAEFDEALRALAAAPASVAVQAQTLGAAASVANTMRKLSVDAQAMRQTASADIERQVRQVNDALAAIEALNGEIVSGQATGRDVTALLDERDRQLNTVNGIIPIRVALVGEGKVQVFSSGGAVMLDGVARPLSFTGEDVITADMSVEGGDLEGLIYEGADRGPTSSVSPFFKGGSLEAAFRVRDVIVPEFTAQLDALARDLIERFQAVPGADAGDVAGALGTGGLFVDENDALLAQDYTLNPDRQVGLAGRIAINASVDPDQVTALGTPGELRRLRDGVDSAAGGDVADAAIAEAMVGAMTQARNPADPVQAEPPFAALNASGFQSARSATQLVEDVTSLREQAAATADVFASFSAGTATALLEQELAISAVDTDAELQSLLRIETAYAANARVIQTVDEMLARLLEI